MTGSPAAQPRFLLPATPFAASPDDLCAMYPVEQGDTDGTPGLAQQDWQQMPCQWIRFSSAYTAYPQASSLFSCEEANIQQAALPCFRAYILTAGSAEEGGLAVVGNMPQ